MSEEKLNELKEKVAGLQEELKELTPEELEQVTGGSRKGSTAYARELIGAAVGGVGVLLK